MERARRLTQFWNWLPAFRVVAETEHLPTAAQQLGITASALSRTIKLLEEELGVGLFHRVGRRLALSDAGEEFLSAVRDAMRRVDDGLSLVEPGELSGRLRLASRSTHGWVVIPAVAAIAREHPRVMPVLRTMSDALMGPALRRGEIDVGVADHPMSHRDLCVDKLAEVTYGVYCGRGHPLHGVATLAPRALERHPFIGPPEGVTDQWPAELDRQVMARVDLFFTGVALAESGAYLALLPDPVARGQEHLWRLPFDLDVRTSLYVVYRRPVGQHALTRLAIEQLGAAAS